jgi:hypothetical protein
MSLKTAQKTINGREYTVTQLGAGVGRECLRRLMRIAGPALKSAATAGGGGSEALFSGLGDLFMGLSQEDLTYFCDTFGAFSTVRLDENREPKVKAQFETLFAGNYWEMAEWLAFCVEVNFASFFAGALEKMMSGVIRAPGSAQTSPPSA